MVTTDKLRPVRIWLYLLALMVLAMVIVGGITRLTDSGLSITSWKPISGAIPPLSAADWQAEFDAYKKIPEFAIQNSWMSVDQFKFIFWWEWAHRFLGRLIGLVFAVPFLVFVFQRRLNWKLAPMLGTLFLLGGLQGLIGWWMVSSGLTQRTDVSQYRLAIHLGTACILFIALIVAARRLTPQRTVAQAVPTVWFWSVAAFAALIYVQILAGAFVAGLDAGFGYNTWPLMEGAIIPAGLGTMEPFWRNLFENTLTVQFIHRMIAYTVFAYAMILLWRGQREPGFTGVHGWLPRIALLVVLQVALGISTLLLVVPLPLASGHQALAFMLVGACAAYLADMTRASAVK